jgi:hypothetical protein
MNDEKKPGASQSNPEFTNIPFTPQAIKARRSRQVAAIAAKLNIDPFETLLYFVAGNWKALGYASEKVIKESKGGVVNEEYTIPISVRASSAADACKYLYPQLKSIEGSITTKRTGRPLAKLTDEELDEL